MKVYTIPLSGSEDEDSRNRKKYLIFRPMAGLAFVGNRTMVALAERTGGETWSADQEPPQMASAVAFLREIGFLEPDPPQPPAQPTEFKSLVLLLTNSCHLRCTYCYAAAGELPHQEISEEHARAAIDFFFEQAIARGLQEVEVSFHGGGEPTFAWDLLKNITNYVRSKPLKTIVSLTTNGMWSTSQRKWIPDHIDRVGISMDGMPETQNRQRPLASGKASAPIVLRNMAEMDKCGKPYSIRMTVTAPWTQLPEDVAFICEKTGAQGIQAEPAFNTGRGHHMEPPEDEWRAFADAFVKAYDVAYSHNRRLHYSGARVGLVTNMFCTSPYQSLVVAPGGRLVACYEITSETHPLAAISTFGKVEDGQVQVDQLARENFHRLLAERRSTCEDCFCYESCAGDCYAQAFGPGEQGHLLKTARCQVNRYLTEQILLGLIAKGNGYWSGRDNQAWMFRTPVSPEEEELHG
jgi:uncharacterized protein